MCPVYFCVLQLLNFPLYTETHVPELVLSSLHGSGSNSATQQLSRPIALALQPIGELQQATKHLP